MKISQTKISKITVPLYRFPLEGKRNVNVPEYFLSNRKSSLVFVMTKGHMWPLQWQRLFVSIATFCNISRML